MAANPGFKWLAQVVLSFAAMAALFFLAAGRLDAPRAWSLFGMYLVYFVVLVRVADPDLIVERSTAWPAARRWDRFLLRAYNILLPLILFVAGLDSGRFGWTPSLPAMVPLAALLLNGLALSMMGWAMATNIFFSTVVRIQKERGHTVVSGGPYHYVRHPGYVGMILSILCMPLALGSAYALIPAGIAVGIVVARTVLEDRTLQAELEGYKEYAQQVRYRLVPGVW